jgi:hypothetical protein
MTSYQQSYVAHSVTEDKIPPTYTIEISYVFYRTNAEWQFNSLDV